MVLNSFLSLVYPPLCLHCNECLPVGQNHFCMACMEEFSLIEPRNRCPLCFAESEMAKLSACLDCRRRPPVLTRIAAACDQTGSVQTLLTQLRNGSPYLAKGAGALMAAQLLQLNWPLPDLLVPVPIPFTRWFERGYNQSRLLADQVGKIIDRPVKEILKRKSGDVAQSKMSREQRLALSGDNFVLKAEPLKGKTVLLVDDQLATGTTLRRCGELLFDEQPKAVYGLVFARGF